MQRKNIYIIHRDNNHEKKKHQIGTSCTGHSRLIDNVHIIQNQGYRMDYPAIHVHKSHDSEM